MAGVFIAIILMCSFVALQGLHLFGSATAGPNVFIEKGESLTGVKNMVTAITLNLRRLDYLGALAAVFTAVISTLVVLRPKGRKRTDERDGIDS
jgi:multisubunit Na+/H+ antiporter MnhB subunit